jgi:isopentenyl diphosphate isomerase/L-lactate dehydrogenase-like FMN-dependent dehydrogenase
MGEAGVTRTIELIRKELSVSMALTGQTDVRRLAPDIIWRKPADGVLQVVSTTFDAALVPCRGK